MLSFHPQQRFHTLGKHFRLPEFTLPDNNREPVDFRELSLLPTVPLHVPTELVFPELSARLWIRGESAPWVAMPEASMHEDHRPVSRQDDVGGSGQVAAVQTEPIAETVKDLPNRQLR